MIPHCLRIMMANFVATSLLSFAPGKGKKACIGRSLRDYKINIGRSNNGKHVMSDVEWTYRVVRCTKLSIK